MAIPADLTENDELINRHVLLSKELFDQGMKEAKLYHGGNFSMWVRDIMRKHFKHTRKKLES